MHRLFICFLFASALSAQAQQSLHNAGNLRVHSGSTVTMFGNFSNGNTAQYINDATVRLIGNLVNDQASMNAGSGTMYLQGSAQQTISGAQTFNTYNLVSNNSAGLVLNNSIGISNQHTFSAGIITSSNTSSFVIYEAGASYSGSSDSRHVNGWVKKRGTTNFIYPVGNGTVLRTISITSLSASSEFNVRHNMTTPNQSNLQSPLYMVDPNEYWNVNQVSGGSAQLLLNWDNSKVPFPNWLLSDIRVAGYNGSLWTNRGGSASGNATTTGTITSNSVSSFGPVTFGSISAILPLNLLSFSAVKEQNHANLFWKTEYELNVDRYEVERKDQDGLKFYKIGQVNALNSPGVNNYNLIDPLPLQQLVQYRLRTVDRDGAYSYSNIITLRSDSEIPLMKLLTNPVRQTVSIAAPATLSGVYRYDVVSSTGMQMQSGNIYVNGSGVYTIYLSQEILPGMYILTVRNKSYTLTEKIVVRP